MKKSIYTLGIVTVLFITACSNTQTTSVSSSTITSTAPSSSVAEVKEDDYVYIGGKTPYEVLTATEEANIRKAEEEAKLQAEAKKKAEAEAKAKAQAEAQQAEVQANQQVEQAQSQVDQQEAAEQTGGVQQAKPLQRSAEEEAAMVASGDYYWYTFPSGQRVLMANNAYIAHKYDYENAPDEKSRQQAWNWMQYDLANGVDPNSVIRPQY